MRISLAQNKVARQPTQVQKQVKFEEKLEEANMKLYEAYQVMGSICHNKEKRYENIIFHYQYGLGYIKDYDPLTYQKIIRIAMLREDFSYDVEKEFKEQVNINKF